MRALTPAPNQPRATAASQKCARQINAYSLAPKSDAQFCVFMRSYFVCVSGTMGSGKTTLAQNLSRRLGWSYLPESPNAVAFLKDLFADPRRWAFDAQVSFFTEKAIQLKDAIDTGIAIILDRSLSEDIHIFARHFRESGCIDERSYRTYLDITEHFLEELPTPDLILYCEAPNEVILERIRNRSETKDSIYPAGHIEKICDRYDLWRSEYNESPIATVDGSFWDFRKKDVVGEIARELLSALEGPLDTVEQLDLFQTTSIKKDQETFRVLKLSKDTPRRPRLSVKTPAPTTRWSIPLYPFVYIAAPFSGKAEEIPTLAKPQAELFDTGAAHGRLRIGRYRRSLSKISTAFKDLGVNVLLPHRDVNEWGAKSLNSFDVMFQCTNHVLNCDLFFGLLGQSVGAHYEYGIARAKGTPSIIVHCAELADSFIAEGVEGNRQTLVVSCERLEDIPKLILRPNVQMFIKRNLSV